MITKGASGLKTEIVGERFIKSIPSTQQEYFVPRLQQEGSYLQFLTANEDVFTSELGYFPFPKLFRLTKTEFETEAFLNYMPLSSFAKYYPEGTDDYINHENQLIHVFSMIIRILYILNKTLKIRHNDLHHGNIFVENDSDMPRVKIIDFDLSGSSNELLDSNSFLDSESIKPCKLFGKCNEEDLIGDIHSVLYNFCGLAKYHHTLSKAFLINKLFSFKQSIFKTKPKLSDKELIDIYYSFKDTIYTKHGRACTLGEKQLCDSTDVKRKFRISNYSVKIKDIAKIRKKLPDLSYKSKYIFAKKEYLDISIYDRAIQ